MRYCKFCSGEVKSHAMWDGELVDHVHDTIMITGHYGEGEASFSTEMLVVYNSRTCASCIVQKLKDVIS